MPGYGVDFNHSKYTLQKGILICHHGFIWNFNESPYFIVCGLCTYTISNAFYHPLDIHSIRQMDVKARLIKCKDWDDVSVIGGKIFLTSSQPNKNERVAARKDKHWRSAYFQTQCVTLGLINNVDHGNVFIANYFVIHISAFVRVTE